MIRFLAALALMLLMPPLLIPTSALAAPAPPVDRYSYPTRPEVREFVAEMVQRHGFAEQALLAFFRGAKRQPEILAAIRPPVSPRTRSWQHYRPIFVNDRHVAEGVRFIGRHAEALIRAEAEYGVPKEIIVAIIGVETFYGQNMGKWRVADALATLAFDYPPRAEYFRSELEAFLLFTREAKLDPMEVRGSYAGAIGIPQFMPNSYRRWAVDFDGDGVALLRSSPVDAIGSVANFLKFHGWRPGEPIAYPAAIGRADPAAFIAAGLKPSFPLEDLAAAGIGISAEPPAKPGSLGALVDLVTPDYPTEYRVGLENFYVLTRYNRSSFYASAVMDLAQAFRFAMR
jgi:membrane-bound lytic murein transglycosylase B